MNVLEEILKLPKEERIKLVDAGNMPLYSREEVKSSITKC